MTDWLAVSYIAIVWCIRRSDGANTMHTAYSMFIKHTCVWTDGWECDFCHLTKCRPDWALLPCPKHINTRHHGARQMLDSTTTLRPCSMLVGICICTKNVILTLSCVIIQLKSSRSTRAIFCCCCVYWKLCASVRSCIYYVNWFNMPCALAH